MAWKSGLQHVPEEWVRMCQVFRVLTCLEKYIDELQKEEKKIRIMITNREMQWGFWRNELMLSSAWSRLGFITAHIQKMGEGIFSVFVSVHTSIRGYPFHQWEEVPHPRSGWGVPPSQVWTGGWYPIPGPDGGTPSCWWWGYPHSKSGWGVPQDWMG